MSEQKTLGYNQTALDVSLLVLRVVAGLVFAVHGAQKLFGAFEGPGLAGTIEMMKENTGVVLAYL